MPTSIDGRTVIRLASGEKFHPFSRHNSPHAPRAISGAVLEARASVDAWRDTKHRHELLIAWLLGAAASSAVTFIAGRLL